jgi:hypothetical protein
MADEQGPERRAETGPMMFGMDWPGVFIRGDNAFAFGAALSRVLEGKGWDSDPDTLWGLVALLVSCQIGLPLNTHPMETQRMLEYEKSRCGKKPADFTYWTEEGVRLREHIKELLEALGKVPDMEPFREAVMKEKWNKEPSDVR